MDIYLIRHTRVAVAPGLCYGRQDVPLAASFATEATSVCERLPALKCVYSSPSTRCRCLAQQLADQDPETWIETDERLLELDFGQWEGQTWDQLDSPVARAWGEDFIQQPCPGGESYAQLANRVARWRQDLCSDHACIAVVSHGGPLRALLADFLDLPLALSFRFAIDCGSISLLRSTGNLWQAQFVNRRTDS